MNQETDDRFWSVLGESLRPRLGEAQWTAQRARILARLTPAPTGRPPMWATAGALACLAAAWLLMPEGKSPPVAVTVPVATPVPIADWDARVTLVEGQVTIFSKGADEGVPAAEGMPLEEGDSVRTGAEGRAELAFSTNSVIALGPASIITLSDLAPRQTLLNLDLGTLMAKLRWKGTPGRRMDVMTPTAVAAVRGTEFGVAVLEGGETSVAVFDEGRVAVRTKDNPSIEETMLEPRQEVLVPAGPIAETETREGRNYLRVGELSRLKSFQEQIERIRERPEELSRSWKELDRPAREKVRSRMLQEHRVRMEALPPEERSSLRERLRRPEGGLPQRMERPEGPGTGEPRRDLRGEKRGGNIERQPPPKDDGARRPPPGPSRSAGGADEPGLSPRRPERRDPSGEANPGRGGLESDPRPPRAEYPGRESAPRQERPGRPEGENGPRPDNRFPRERGGREQGQPPREGGTPGPEQGPGRREHGPREGGGMHPPGGRRQHPGGEGRGHGGQQRERRGSGRERRH